MLVWLIVGITIVTIFVVIVLRDAIADDRRRKLEKPRSNYSGY